MARKSGKKRKENPVGCTREGKRLKGNRRELILSAGDLSSHQLSRSK